MSGVCEIVDSKSARLGAMSLGRWYSLGEMKQ